MNIFCRAQRDHTAGFSGAERPQEKLKFEKLEGHFKTIIDIKWVIIYSKVNIWYFNPLAYDYITKIALF